MQFLNLLKYIKKTGIQHEVQVFTIYSHIHIAIKQTIVLKVNKTASDHVDDFLSTVRNL